VETAVWECELGVSRLEVYWKVTSCNLVDYYERPGRIFYLDLHSRKT
jgi:hypothetical protein